MTKPITPQIVTRLNLPEGNPPGRVYFHESGIQSFSGEGYTATFLEEDFYLHSVPGTDPISRATRHTSALWMRDNLPRSAKEYLYLVGILWGNEQKDKLWDFFGFEGIPKSPKDWPGNADIFSFYLSKGVLVPRHGPYVNVTCEEGFDLVAAEGRHRKRCHNMGEFRLHPPKIRVRNKLTDIVITR